MSSFLMARGKGQRSREESAVALDQNPEGKTDILATASGWTSLLHWAWPWWPGSPDVAQEAAPQGSLLTGGLNW